MKRENKLEKYSDEQIKEILKDAISFSDVLRKFGYESITTGNYKLVKGILKNRQIEVPIYNYFKEFNNFNRKKSIEELFINDSTVNRQHLKNIIIKDKLIDYKCDKCGNNGEWQNEKLILQLEHKNGDTYDNRLENLSFLCPNCHSQTSTFSGRNSKRFKKEKTDRRCKCGKEISSTAFMCISCNSKENRKVDRPDYEILMKEINESSQNKVAKKYGVSWRTIRKWRINYEKIDG